MTVLSTEELRELLSQQIEYVDSYVDDEGRLCLQVKDWRETNRREVSKLIVITIATITVSGK